MTHREQASWPATTAFEPGVSFSHSLATPQTCRLESRHGQPEACTVNLAKNI